MKKVLILVLTITCLCGCGTYRSAPRVTYWYNSIYDCLGTNGVQWIYDYMSPLIGVMDNQESVPVHYRIFLPDKRNMKKIFSMGDDRCFLYSKGRGIAIFQDIVESGGTYENGIRQISASSADDQLFPIAASYGTEIRLREGRKHYMYVEDEIMILMFNLTDEDYEDYVELPINSFTIRR